MKYIRTFLGKLILFFDRLFPPTPLVRSAEDQKKMDGATSKLTLYQFETCPFCVKVRRELRRLNLQVQIRDALNDKNAERELIEGGGKRQVPCLRIYEDAGQPRWLYESSDIITYLNKRFEI